MPRTLPKMVSKSKKRVGRGIGSGKGGHTVGRGQKGQKSRGDKVGVTFEGLKMKKSLIKRLPFKRGKGKFLGHSKPVIVFLESLEILPAKSKVNMEILVSSGIVDVADAKRLGVKILGNGNISKALTILVPISAGATEKIKKAGGSVEEIKA